MADHVHKWLCMDGIANDCEQCIARDARLAELEAKLARSQHHSHRRKDEVLVLMDRLTAAEAKLREREDALTNQNASIRLQAAIADQVLSLESEIDEKQTDIEQLSALCSSNIEAFNDGFVAGFTHAHGDMNTLAPDMLALADAALAEAQAEFAKRDAEIDRLRGDADRLDWLDRDTPAGDEPRLRAVLNLMLAEYQPIRDAIDAAMRSANACEEDR